MVFYKSGKWKSKRDKIFRRDKYLCQECIRHGKTTQADTVHHIKPLESNPELYLDSKNLISLCKSCHNSMHDRVTNELTDKGMQLLRRIYRE